MDLTNVWPSRCVFVSTAIQQRLLPLIFESSRPAWLPIGLIPLIAISETRGILREVRCMCLQTYIRTALSNALGGTVCMLNEVWHKHTEIRCKFSVLLYRQGNWHFHLHTKFWVPLLLNPSTVCIQNSKGCHSRTSETSLISAPAIERQRFAPYGRESYLILTTHHLHTNITK